MVPTLLLLLFSLTLVQPSNGKCDLFTTKDVEGPFFEVRKLWILALKKALYSQMPRNITSWPRAMNWMTEVKRSSWKGRLVKISVYWGIFFYFDQVFDRYCNGISGALVEVWYAGGEPGCGEYFTLNSWTVNTPSQNLFVHFQVMLATPSLVGTLSSGIEARSTVTAREGISRQLLI